MIITRVLSSTCTSLRCLAGCLLGAMVWLQPAHAEEPFRKGYIETFDDAAFRKRWWFANYESGGPHSATSWRRRMASVVIPVVDHKKLGGALTLRLVPTGKDAARPFLGAEAQQGGKHSYGDYETIMQAGKGAGVVTAFFTYTGPHFGNPHDEIDFEILGKDTNSVWINRFVDGERMPGQLLPLGFDSAASPNLYKIAWREDSITWSVNGVEIYRVISDEMSIPSHPSKLILSLWAGNPKQIEWLGKIEPNTRTNARFFCVSYRPVGAKSKVCSDMEAAPS